MVENTLLCIRLGMTYILSFRSRLSKWKVKTLSIGGRLTLLKSVLGASPIYNMSIFKVPTGVLKVMESIRSPFFNGATKSEKKVTWVAGIKVLLQKNIGLESRVFCSLNRALLSMVLAFCDDSYSRFRCWIGDRSQRVKFPRLFVLDLNKEASVAVKLSAPIDISFPLLFCYGNFRVKEIRNYIDDLFLPHQAAQTRWIKYIPIKVNIFAWRARQDCLPTRVNLIRRGITIESSLCPVCSVCEEDVCHIFFRCDLAQLVLRRICRWWGLDPHDWSSFQEWQSWILSIQFSSKLERGLVRVSNDRELSYMFDVEETLSRLDLYLDHLDMDLLKYLSQVITTEMHTCVSKIIDPPKKGQREGISQDATEGVEARTSTTDKGKEKVSQDETKGVEARISTIDKGKEKVSQNETKGVESMASTVYSDCDSEFDSEYDSDKSVDYLTPGEEELIKLRNMMKANREAKAKAKGNPVGEKHVTVEQFKECLTYYALANGFSLWYERSSRKKMVAKCGQRPPRLSVP
ncbi:RNA-directed DNA polymerase, eukaryota [Tanacetum coccineum]